MTKDIEKNFISIKPDQITDGVNTDLSGISTDDLKNELSSRGWGVEKLGWEEIDNRFDIPAEMFETDKVQLAVVACTHFGSKYQQITHLHRFYHYCQEEYGIKVFLHCGDLVDGEKVYKGHEYELFLHGADAQIDYVCNNYPKVKNGGVTFAIAGNHDHSFVKNAGINPVRRIAEHRDDIEYIGLYGAYPKIKHPKVRKQMVYIHHADGGAAYARSYKLQKSIEQLSSDSKPDVYFLAHYHVSCTLPKYRNICGIMIPCFQSRTPYLKRKRLNPEIMGLIVEFKINDFGRKNNIVEIAPKWMPFYKRIENDY